MKHNIIILILIFFSICTFAQIKPIEDPKQFNTTPIENININEPQIDDKTFEEIPIDKNFASKEEYNKEITEIYKKYNIKPLEKDPLYNEKDIFRPAKPEVYLISDKINILKAGVSLNGKFQAEEDYYYLEGENFHFKNQHSGNAENVILTTCKNHHRPHISFHAKKLSFTQKPGQISLHFKNIGIKVNNTNILWLPYYKMTINKSNYSRILLIPFISYSGSNGIGIRLHPRLFESGRFYLDTDVRWSVKKNFRYNFYANFAIDKDFGNNPFIDDVSMSKVVTSLNDIGRTSPYKNGFGADDYKDRAHLTAKIGTVWKDSETDIKTNQDLDVYKSIVANLKYSFDPFGNMKALNLYSLITPGISCEYSREKDEPTISQYINKYKLNFTIPYALAQYKGINIQPLIKFDYINYKNYNSYKIYSAGLDLSHYYKDGSLWNIRYIASKDEGIPMLETDTLDQERGIMLSGKKNINDKYIISGWYGYNDKVHKTMRYGLALGLKDDCFYGSVGYDFKKRQLYTSMAILGF